ncbi:MAG: PQQ-binding-like beta-propeller repeat protein [Phycisphaerales bacterium]
MPRKPAKPQPETALGYGARVLVAVCGLAVVLTDATNAQVIAPNNRLRPGAAFAGGQPLPVRKVYTDEAVGAIESLVRVKELEAANNLTEAVRVLQETIEKEGEQVLPDADDARTFETVRVVTRRMLLQSPKLLERYLQQNEPRAAELLEKGQIEQVESSFFLTNAGFEATLRVAQTQLERARFHAARITLEQLDKHPARTGAKSIEAAKLLAQVAAFVGPDLVRERVALWSADSPVELPKTFVAPKAAIAVSRDPFEASPWPKWDALDARPLQTSPLGAIARELDNDPQSLLNRSDEEAADIERSSPSTAWVMPAVLGETLFVNDGDSLAALDASTLAELWRSTLQPVTARRANEDMYYGLPNSRSLEDVSSAAVARGVVVAAFGHARGGTREGDARVHAFDAATGKELWAVDPAYLDDRLSGVSVRGTPLIEGDMVVLSVRKPTFISRVTSLYMVGLDLRTGELRWVRQVGSVGMQPWGRAQARGDTSLLRDGVIYRADDMGIVGAFEATTGRCLWLRLTQPVPEQDINQSFSNVDATPTYLVHQPVIIGNLLFVVEPSYGSVIALDPLTGRPQARVDDRATGRPVHYLLAAGRHLAMVTDSGVVFCDATKFGSSNVVKGAELDNPPAGRGVVLEDRNAQNEPVFKVALPLANNTIAIFDPARPQAVPEVRAFQATGNLLVTGTPADPAALLIAEPSKLNTFLSWDRAEAGLQRRATASPNDPVPTLTYLELALRMGRYELAPKLSDQVLGILRKPAAGVDSEAARARLFNLLSSTLTRSRLALSKTSEPNDAKNVEVDETSEPPAPGTAADTVRIEGVKKPEPAQAIAVEPLRDLALLSQLEQRMSRAADTPVQRVQALLERAFLREFEQKPVLAADALQEVLLDDSLSAALLPTSAVAQATGDTRMAGDVATVQLTALMERWGAQSYAAYDEEAQRLLDQLPENAPASEVSSLAKRYPLAQASAIAWKRVGLKFLEAGDRESAREALRKGVACAQSGVRIGRETAGATLSESLSALLGIADRAGDIQPLQRLLLTLHERSPNLTLTTSSGTQTLLEAAQSLALHPLETNRTLPTLAQKLQATPQVIEGWNILPSVSNDLAGVSRDVILMTSRRGDVVSAFGTSAITGRLEQLWKRDIAMAPVVVRVTPEYTVLFWPQSGSASLEAISNITGKTAWKSSSLSTLPGWVTNQPPPAPGSRPDQFNTPLDGIVRGEDLLFAISNGQRAGAITICDRRGKAASFSLQDGSLLWSGATQLSAVYDLEQSGLRSTATTIDGKVLLVGAIGNQLEISPAVLCVDLATGKEAWRLSGNVLGRHARFARFTPENDVLIAVGDGLLRVRGSDGEAMWQSAANGVREAMGAWLVPGNTKNPADHSQDGCFVLNGDFQLWRIDPATGKVGDGPVSTQDRITLPFSATIVGDHLALSSSLGVALVHASGKLSGTDALDSPGRLEPGIVCENEVLVLESGDREQLQTGEVMNATRLIRLDARTAKLRGESRIVLFESPDAISVLDNKLLIGQGPFTLVYDFVP